MAYFYILHREQMAQIRPESYTHQSASLPVENTTKTDLVIDRCI